MAKRVFATFLTGNGSYLPGVLALDFGLKRVNSSYPLVVFTTSSIDKTVKEKLIRKKIKVIQVNSITPPDEIKKLNIASGFKRWNESFSKLEILKQSRFEKIIFLDADMLIKKNIDHLFDSPNLSAVAAGNSLRPSWIDLNSGLLVIQPSNELYKTAINCLNTLSKSNSLERYRAIGDQDILHLAFPEWPTNKKLHLSEKYNMLSYFMNKTIKNGYVNPQDISIIHFASSTKPWNYSIIDWIKILIRQLHYLSFFEFNATRDYLTLINKANY